MYQSPVHRQESAGLSIASTIETGGAADAAVVDPIRFSGEQKRFLLSLVERLEKRPSLSTVNAVCGELRLATDAPDAKAHGARPVPQPRRALIAGPKALAVPSTSAPAVAPLPQSDDVVITQALTDMGAEEVRRRCTRLSSSVDRLLRLVPEDMHTFRGHLIALRDRYATPPARIEGKHAEMLEGGHLVLTAICNELERRDPSTRKGALWYLSLNVPKEGERGSQVSKLFHGLTFSESFDVDGDGSGDNDLHLSERRTRFEAWAEPLLKSSKLTEAEVSRGMKDLGLELPDLEGEGGSMWLHPVYNNAAWRACLGIPLDPNDVPALANVDRAELVLALDGLRQRCEGLRVDTTALDRFSDTWLGHKPSDDRDDRVWRLQGAGVDSLWRINEHLAGKGDRGSKRQFLVDMMRSLSVAQDPANELRFLTNRMKE
jgi:hypothetical protein